MVQRRAPRPVSQNAFRFLARNLSLTGRSSYADIVLVGQDSLAHKKKFKVAQGSRMMLLRRTLRANPDLARLVRSLKVPELDIFTMAANSRGPSPFEQYENAVAALVMACPNLERLVGPVFGYDHSFKRLFHALSTRTNLKDMNWLIEPSSVSRQQYSEGLPQCGQMLPAALQASQELAFFEQHRAWAKLTSLSIHCLREASMAPETLLARTLTVLPALQHLHLSNLSANAFNDTNLLSLPRLKTLALSNIPGISSDGLSRFATRSNSRPLRKTAPSPHAAYLVACLGSYTVESYVARLVCSRTILSAAHARDGLIHAVDDALPRFSQCLDTALGYHEPCGERQRRRRHSRREYRGRGDSPR